MKRYHRDEEVLELIHKNFVRPYCLKKNQDGSPAHPLYLAKNLAPMPFV